ncbi:MAG: acyl-CoA synthetase FdrA [Candidatus Eisenbacteria sp.]|nr:acyl-CoA synthetase FdrA [Candidatus Eisenbacteria bacterium]
MKKIRIRKGVYCDSVRLLLLSREMGDLDGVDRAMAAMATPTNLEILGQLGWSLEEIGDVAENDLLAAVDAADERTLDAAFQWLETRLKERVSGTGKGYHPRTLRTAVADAPSANLVQISIPGAYAFREAKRALMNDKHVMLFSDNVSIEEEVALKDLAGDRGLLLMGPDCGTAIINGVCLGFANVVPRGPVGIVAASGTGAQEISVLLARGGIGVSQLIGTGGRDLSRKVAGRAMRLGLRALAADPETEVMVLVSKPPEPEVAERILTDAASCAKPVIVNFLGENPDRITRGNVRGAGNLEEAAQLAIQAAGRRAISLGEGGVPALVEQERSRLKPGQRFLRGLFVGGTLADEAMLLLKTELGTLYSNSPVPGCTLLVDSSVSRGHTVLDLGADEFTVGRAHPMIDPTLRNFRIVEEAMDSEVAVLLLDVVLGYGSHADPAGATAGAVEEARGMARKDDRDLVVVASVCGTEGDPQNLDEQEQKLRDVGVRVFASNAQACRFCRELLRSGHAEDS